MTVWGSGTRLVLPCHWRKDAPRPPKDPLDSAVGLSRNDSCCSFQLVSRSVELKCPGELRRVLIRVMEYLSRAGQSPGVKNETRRIRRERATVRAMVEMYCAHHHGAGSLCEECAEIADYADRRLDCCPYGPEKPTCVDCPIHCYRPDPRERMREMMRFAGPRMFKKHPYLAVMHLIDGRRPPPPTPKRVGESSTQSSGAVRREGLRGAGDDGGG